MQLISAKCPDCGAELNIPVGSLNVRCDYCGNNILVSDVLGSNSLVQNCMTLAYAELKGENYKDAYDHFDKALQMDTSNYNAWFGKAICAGMLSRIADCRFDEVIVLYDNAIKNAPVDKQGNIRKNAAAEIVKAVRNSSGRMQLADQLFMSVSQGRFSTIIGGLQGGIQNMIAEVNRALQKAHEYDPSNNDVTVLMNEISTGGHFNTGSGFVQTSTQTFQPQTPAVSGPIYGKKKNSGCVAAVIGIILVVAVIIVVSLLPKTNKFVTTTNKPTQPQYYSSYTYSEEKMTSIEGKIYVGVYTDAVEDSSFAKINLEIITKYAAQNKPIIINYFSSKTQASKNVSVQTTRSYDWLLKNAQSINLRVTSEYDPTDYSMNIYRYEKGKTKKINYQIVGDSTALVKP